LTEVPDYLFQRSRDRRRALGLPVADDGDASGGDAGGPAGAGSAVVAAAPESATVLKAVDGVALPADRDLPPEVVADNARKKPPIWASAVLVALPLWAFLYVAMLGETVVEQVGALAFGQEIYEGKGGCAACHGATGGGGTGPAFSGGEIVLTFPDLEEHEIFVQEGAIGRVGDSYGDPDREGGQRTVDLGAMPAFGESLSESELFAVVRYEREVLGGEEVDEATLEERELLFEELGGGAGE
jgi:mono/diheme cytochrome c family protein